MGKNIRISEEYKHGTFASEADIRIAPSGYWVGFTALLLHSRSVHHGRPGIPLKIIFDFHELSAELNI